MSALKESIRNILCQYDVTLSATMMEILVRRLEDVVVNEQRERDKIKAPIEEQRSTAAAPVTGSDPQHTSQPKAGVEASAATEASPATAQLDKSGETGAIAFAKRALRGADGWLTSMPSLDHVSRIEHAVDIIRDALKKLEDESYDDNPTGLERPHWPAPSGSADEAAHVMAAAIASGEPMPVARIHESSGGYAVLTGDVEGAKPCAFCGMDMTGRTHTSAIIAHALEECRVRQKRIIELDEAQRRLGEARGRFGEQLRLAVSSLLRQWRAAKEADQILTMTDASYRRAIDTLEAIALLVDNSKVARAVQVDASGREILKAVLAAMQSAEEIGGPENEQYTNLMANIADEAVSRLVNYCANDLGAPLVGKTDAVLGKTLRTIESAFENLMRVRKRINPEDGVIVVSKETFEKWVNNLAPYSAYDNLGHRVASVRGEMYLKAIEK